MLQIKVLSDQCIGAASCVAIAPGTFQLDDESKSTVVNQQGDAPDQQLAAAKACPVNAIIIVDVAEDGTEKQVWPPEAA